MEARVQVKSELFYRKVYQPLLLDIPTNKGLEKNNLAVVMRLFLSCKIPEEITSYLREVTKLLPPNASLTVPKQFDLTIRFFGEVEEELFQELEKRLSTLRVFSFRASLETIHVFSEKTIRTVWAGISPKENFCALHEAVEKALLPLIPHDPRFLPHITLARVKALPNKKEFLQNLSRITIEPRSFMVDQLVLVRSTTTHEGAIHTPLFTIPLI